MEEVTLTVEAGRPVGSRPARRLRRAGKIPAVLYGHGVDAMSLAVDARSLRGALTTDAGVNALITLQVDGDRHLAMARQLQRDPVRGTVTHVDFVIVRRDEVVSAEVPVHLVGDAEAVHRENGLVNQEVFALPIKAKPGDIPGAIEVDVSRMVIGDTIRVEDLRLPPGVTTDLDPEAPVAVGAASTAAAEVAAAEEEAAAEAAAEGVELEGAPAEGEGEAAAEGATEAPAAAAEGERGGAPDAPAEG